MIPGARSALAAGVVALILPLVFAAPARAQGLDIPVMIQTRPRMPGATFSLDGRTFRADEHGLALITVGAPGTYHLRAPATLPLPGEGRAGFALWSDGDAGRARPIDVRSFTYLQAGFDRSYRITPEFVQPGAGGGGAAPAPVTSFTVVDDSGHRQTFEGRGKVWLLASRAGREGDRLVNHAVSYRIASIGLQSGAVSGTGVPAFSPRGAAPWRVTIPLYDVAIEVRDRLLASPLSGRLSISYPDGHREVQPVGDDGSVTLHGVGAGDYEARALSGGIALDTSFTVPASGTVSVSVVSGLDLALAAAGLLLLALAFLSTRPSVRAAWRARRRPRAAPRRARPSAPRTSATQQASRQTTAAPRTASPRTGEPQRASAQTTAAPRTSAPRTAAPQQASSAQTTAVPPTAVPPTAAPETAAPETAAPETAAPETAVPREAPAGQTAPERDAVAQRRSGAAAQMAAAPEGAGDAAGSPWSGGRRRERVRVRLRGGRVVEGWRQSSTTLPPVTVLDVERVLDAEGRETPSTPMDSFLLASQVLKVEALETAPEEEPADRTIVLDRAAAPAGEHPGPTDASGEGQRAATGADPPRR